LCSCRSRSRRSRSCDCDRDRDSDRATPCDCVRVCGSQLCVCAGSGEAGQYVAESLHVGVDRHRGKRGVLHLTPMLRSQIAGCLASLARCSHRPASYAKLVLVQALADSPSHGLAGWCGRLGTAAGVLPPSLSHCRTLAAIAAVAPWLPLLPSL